MPPMSQAEAEAFLGKPPGAPPAAPRIGQFSPEAADAFLGPDLRNASNAGSPDLPPSTPEQDAYIASSGIGRVLNAFGHGVKQGWGTTDLGLDSQTEDSLRKAGIFPDVQRNQAGLVRAFNEALLTRSAAALDGLLRLPVAALGGFSGAAEQAGIEVGQPQLGRDIAALPEAFPMGLHSGVPHEAALPSGHAMLDAANAEHVIGAPEAVRQGTAEPVTPAVVPVEPPAAEPPPAQVPAAAPSVSPTSAPASPVPDGSVRFYHGGNAYDGGTRWVTEDRAQAQGYADKAAGGKASLHYVDIPESRLDSLTSKTFDDTGTGQRAPYAAFDAPEDIAQGLRPYDPAVSAGDAARPPPGTTSEPAPAPEPLDVHGVARQIAPDTFQEYDALQAHSAELRQQIADQHDVLKRGAEAQAPNAAQIADLERRLEEGTTPRLAKKYQARLEALRPDHDAFLADDFTMGALTRDTPEIGALRQQLMETDFRLRDLAPDVSAAYREAVARMPADEPADAVPNAAGQVEVSSATNAAPEPLQPGNTGQPEPFSSPASEPPAAMPAPRSAAPVTDIAQDVARKLVAAGRPAEEAEAAAQVTAAMWRARAAAFQGRKGTAAEMYAREAPDIRGQAPRRAPPVARPASNTERPGSTASRATRRDVLPEPTAVEAQASAPATPPAEGTGQRTVHAPGVKPVQVRPEVVPLDSLVASHTPDGQVNAAYPHDEGMQPRDRTGKQSQADVRSIAANLTPERMGLSPEAHSGAPIVSPAGVVESGNGRTMALGHVYTDPALTGRAAAYQEWLRGQGFDTTGIDKPVLIARRVTDLAPDQARAFARAANEATTLRMTAAETAKADAARVGSAIDMWRGSAVSDAANRDFVRAFMAELPSAERGNLVGPDGALSADGARRIQAAVLAHAYGDTLGPVLDRLLNGDTEGVRSIAGAISDAAAPWAQMRAAAQRGEIPRNLDLTRALGQAVQAVDRQRRAGRPVLDALRQSDMLGGGLPSDAEALVRAMFRNDDLSQPASRQAFGDVLRSYAEQASRVSPEPNLFGEPPPGPGELLEAATKRPNLVTTGELFQRREPAVVLRGDELGDLTAPAGREAARAEFQRQRAQGPVQNVDLGEIRFSAKSQGKVFNNAGADKLALLPKLRDILEQGKLVDSQPDFRGRADIKAYHTLSTPVRVGNTDATVRSVIREDGNGRFFYDMQRSDNAPAAEAAPDGTSPGTSTLKEAPSPGADGGPPLPKTYEQRRAPDDGINLSITPRSGAQGKISITPDGRSVITLMRTADASTFVHEMGHDWLERMMRDAADPDAPGSMRQDAATVRDYLGVAEGQAIPTRAHEKFARSFERYLMEGRAPTQALAGVFAKFRDWLTGIYQTVAKLRAPITPAIRDVFDRLLSTDAERQASIVPEGAADLREPPDRSPSGAGPADPVAATSRLADTHEADLRTTEPQDAAPAAAHVRTEIDRAAEAHAPRAADEFATNDAATADGSTSGPGTGATPAEDPAEPGGRAGSDRRPGLGLPEPGTLDRGGDRVAAEGDRVQAGDSGATSTAPGSGRAGEPEAGSNPPAQPFERPADDLTDKAGNIVLRNLNQPQDVLQVIRDTAAEGDDFMDARRGVVSDAQVIGLADALGMTPDELGKRQIGQAFNAEQVVAARKLLVQSAQAVRDAMVKAALGSDADVVAYAEVRARHLLIQEQVSGITAEAGRALRAFRAMGEDGAQAKQLGEFLQGATGRTLFQMRREAQAGLLLDTPGQVSKFVADAAKPTFGDMALEYWINGLISGPATHTTYAVGNALLALWKAGPETGAASAIGAVRRLFGSDADRVYSGEVGAGLYGLMKGQRDGIRAAWKAAKSGLTTELPGENTGMAAASFQGLQAQPRGAIPDLRVLGVPVPLGQAIRLPSRGVAAIHSYFRTIGYEQSMAQLAYRAAAKEGLTGDAFAIRIAQLSTDPPVEMMQEARTQATNQTLMSGGGEFTRKFAELTNTPMLGLRWLKVVDPFVKIGSNVLAEALLERSPLGVFDSEIRSNLMGRNGAVARDQQVARIAVGSALGATAIGLAAQGYLTGGGPSDPREAAVWRLTGKQPYSARIGDTWYEMHRLGPLAMLMGVAADMHELADAMQTHEVSQIAGLMVGALTKGLLHETFMRGPADLIQALEDPDRYGARYVRTQLTTLLPFSTAEGQIARAMDPYARQARTLMDAFKARIPGLSESLLPRRDIWGQPVKNLHDLGMDGVTSIAESRVNRDPVNQALLRLHVYPSPPERRLAGVALSDAQYDTFSRTSGQMAKMRLDALIGQPGFNQLPAGIATKAITGIIESSRRAAGELTKMQNPGLIVQAMQARRALVLNGRPAR